MKKQFHLSIKSRLLGYIIALAAIVLVLASISITTIRNEKANLEKIAKLYDLQLQVGSFHNNLSQLENLLRSHLLANNPETYRIVEKRLQQKFEQIDIDLADLRELTINERHELYMGAVFFEYENYRKIAGEVVALSVQNDSLANLVLEEAALLSITKQEKNLKKIYADIANDIQKLAESGVEQENAGLGRITVIASLIVSLSAFFGFLLYLEIVPPLNRLYDYLYVVSQGSLPDDNLKVKSTEIGKIIDISKVLVAGKKEQYRFAKELNKQNYNYDYKKIGTDDILGNALIKLRDSLVAAKNEAEKRDIEAKQRNWTNRGIAQFNETLRQYSHNLDELHTQIISDMVKYLDAIQGGLFVVSESPDNEKYLELVAAYAYNRQKFLKKEIQLGDGMVGIAAVEKNTIYLTELPDDYLEITSGLGDARPSCLLIVPLVKDEEVLGVIEISSFNTFDDYQIQFLEKVAESIASTLISVRINARTSKLLEESQKKSEELASQDEEMRQNIEELRATQEEGERKRVELQNLLNAVNNSLNKAELELSGKISTANLPLIEMLGMSEFTLKEKMLSDFVSQQHRTAFDKLWQAALSGKTASDHLKLMQDNNKLIDVIVFFSPVYENKQIERILVLAVNFTRFGKQIEQEQHDIAESKIIQLQNRSMELNNKHNKLTSWTIDELNIVYQEWEKQLDDIASHLEENAPKNDQNTEDYEQKLTELSNMLADSEKAFEQLKAAHLKKIEDNLGSDELFKKYLEWLNSLEK